MQDFVDGKFDVLLSTNIVESGLDISNANTMFPPQMPLAYKAGHQTGEPRRCPSDSIFKAFPLCDWRCAIIHRIFKLSLTVSPISKVYRATSAAP